MGILDNQPRMFGRKPYMTPGYGDSTQPGYGQPPEGFGIDPALMQTAPDPYAGQRPDAAPAPPGMFGKGRGLRDAFGYGLGALAQQLGGSNPYEDRMKSDRELEQAMAVARIRTDGRDNETTAEKNLRARGLIPGTREYQAAMGVYMNKPAFTMVGGEPYSEEDLNLPTANTPEEAALFGSGTRFRDSNGNLRRVP